ncbi:hypothetical protein AMECASPLE_038124 [Ameca splendens]|uniref:Uncharacterized protein n=1 Tax=Ameca splendens TaxID=208324 RepID=A0ABV0ZTA4_9TELE
MAHSPLSVQKKKLGPSQVCWWDIHSFLVHFNFSRREKELCSGLFLFCPHKMCFQYKSSVSLFWLCSSMDRCPSQWVWGQTSSEFRFGGNSHCHLQQAGRQELSLSDHDEEASLAETTCKTLCFALWKGQVSKI